jgi:hypothetical protein
LMTEPCSGSCIRGAPSISMKPACGCSARVKVVVCVAAMRFGRQESSVRHEKLLK